LRPTNNANETARLPCGLLRPPRRHRRRRVPPHTAQRSRTRQAVDEPPPITTTSTRFADTRTALRIWPLTFRRCSPRSSPRDRGGRCSASHCAAMYPLTRNPLADLAMTLAKQSKAVAMSVKFQVLQLDSASDTAGCSDSLITHQRLNGRDATQSRGPNSAAPTPFGRWSFVDTGARAVTFDSLHGTAIVGSIAHQQQAAAHHRRRVRPAGCVAVHTDLPLASNSSDRRDTTRCRPRSSAS